MPDRKELVGPRIFHVCRTASASISQIRSSSAGLVQPRRALINSLNVISTKRARWSDLEEKELLDDGVLFAVISGERFQ